jgi:hypothetical protein
MLRFFAVADEAAINRANYWPSPDHPKHESDVRIASPSALPDISNRYPD